jgi:hypothetical protein
VIAGLVLAALVGTTGVLWATKTKITLGSYVLFGDPPFTGEKWQVRKQPLKITVVARGTLESEKNGDIYCNVKSGTKGSTTASTIRWLVDAGTTVKGPDLRKDDTRAMTSLSALAVGLGTNPLQSAVTAAAGKQLTENGQLIMELESSGFLESLKDKITVVKQKEAEMVQAQQEYNIQILENESDIKQKENTFELAKIDLAKYQEGDYIQALKDVEGRIETTQSDLDSWKDRAAWSARMFKKNLMSKVQADADKDREKGALIALQKVQEEKRVLVEYTKPRTLQDLTSKLAEAKLGLTKAKLQAEAKLKQKEAARNTAESVYNQEMARKLEIEGEIAKCHITAPQDGLVVYFIPEQVRGGGGSQQSIVAQGEPVREGQKMMQIPDLKKMVVNVRVPEAMVSFLHGPVPGDKSTWQLAKIKIDAFPSKLLNGHVKFVDTVPSQQDWFAADVKVYKTLVKIDEPLPGLKPGMSAEVTITAEESTTPTLVVPIQSVAGTISMGAHRKVFVINAAGFPEERSVVVGKSNDRLVEIREGLQEGDQVVLDVRTQIKEDSDLKAAKPRGKGGDGAPGGFEGKKGGGDKPGGQPKQGLPKEGGQPKQGFPKEGGQKTGWLNLPRAPHLLPVEPVVVTTLPAAGRRQLGVEVV